MSVHAVCREIDVDLKELPDWNCCGATEYFSQDELTAASVVARNLAIADGEADQLVASCAACYCNLAKVDKLIASDAKPKQPAKKAPVKKTTKKPVNKTPVKKPASTSRRKKT